MQQQILSDRYELERRIGAGGMAEVWLARDRSLGREVALKILHHAYSSDPLFVERFRREAQAAAGLNHPNIVPIYDWGEALSEYGDPDYFIVMQFMPGQDLRELLRTNGALPEAEALGIAADVARALGEAHRQRLVHRDVKPHNILIDPDGVVKVADFGIARAADATQLTQTGSVAGTAQYLSPEQARQLPLDGRSDLYSLGAVLYEMLTGRPPFVGGSMVDVALRHLREPPVPPREIDPAISESSQSIALKALSKDPDHRYGSADEMADALVSARRQLTEAQRTQVDLVVEQRPAVAPAATAEQAEGAVLTDLGPVAIRSRKREEGWSPWLLAIPAAILIFGLTALVIHGFGLSSRGSPSAATKTHHRAGASRVAPAKTPNVHATSAPRTTVRPTTPQASRPVAAAPSTATMQASSAGASSPTTAVGEFYTAVATHDWPRAESLWSPSLKAQYPPATYIERRFANTTGIRLSSSRLSSQSGSTATVAVDLLETQDATTTHWVGSWQEVRAPGGGWLLNQPSLSPVTPTTAPPPDGHGNGKHKGHNGNGSGQQPGEGDQGNNGLLGNGLQVGINP